MSGAGNPNKLAFQVFDNDIGANAEIEACLIKPGKPYWSNMKTTSRDGINNSGNAQNNEKRKTNKGTRDIFLTTLIRKHEHRI